MVDSLFNEYAQITHCYSPPSSLLVGQVHSTLETSCPDIFSASYWSDLFVLVSVVSEKEFVDLKQALSNSDSGRTAFDPHPSISNFPVHLDEPFPTDAIVEHLPLPSGRETNKSEVASKSVATLSPDPSALPPFFFPASLPPPSPPSLTTANDWMVCVSGGRL
ncbi:unnamed protein product [Protopolystoma xenopodis]|uniref:Uncharacterized protein n=1 Tax=Protopolystoma xenopodis TaxID=117903 RepID=A0A448XS42_9PLAT|nr:unnamed protein product [Protopolystoma xenopodis]